MDQDVRDYLEALPAPALVNLVIEQANANEQFMTRLITATHLASGEKPNLADWKKQVTAAYGRGFIDYRSARACAAKVMAMLESVSDINDAGHHETAMTLTEHAHKRTETAAQRVDDSAGWITEIVGEIAAIHLDAVLAGAMSGPKLAKRLVKLELAAELDTFHRSAITYADALGDDGLAEYGALVAKAAEETGFDSSWHGPGFRVQQAMLAHAIATRDPDRVIELVCANREGAGRVVTRKVGELVVDDYLEIANALLASRRDDEALDWLRRGIAGHDSWGHHVDGLRDLASELLAQRGELDEVATLYWDAFVEAPRTKSYQMALENARDAGEARSEALDHVRSLLGEPQLYEIARPHRNASVIGVVETLIAAGEFDEAWDVACRYGTPLEHWETLAEHRRHTSIEDALAVWMQRVHEQIDRREKRHYRKAARLLKPIKEACESAGRLPLYEAEVEQIRRSHPNRPSLLRELENS